MAYATKHNATTEIAESIGETLRQSAGLKVDVRAVDTIDDITSYDVVILGSAVYVSQWQPKAVDFLTNHADELAQRTVWLFSSGPTGEGDPETLLDGWSFPEALQPLVEKIHPRGVKVFHGKLDLDNAELFRTICQPGRPRAGRGFPKLGGDSIVGEAHRPVCITRNRVYHRLADSESGDTGSRIWKVLPVLG